MPWTSSAVTSPSAELPGSTSPSECMLPSQALALLWGWQAVARREGDQNRQATVMEGATAAAAVGIPLGEWDGGRGGW